MVMVHAAFLAELLMKDITQSYDVGSCRIFGGPGMKTDVLGDLILLENQLTLFILEDIFNSTIKPQPKNHKIDIISLVCKFIDYRTDIGAVGYDHQRVQGSNPVHFLD
ncbi:hypothetical protein CDL15_Pgr015736 [Punica granatum]|uniref:Uncharacterized protein n=1 Tax=Punica granatum TaxID=22663 RepID=A0A218XPD5_PUNGR|nr:hypothetical protein CDL15_Pgr015736 [Punica granatum]